jgi:hypothetical protein
MDTKQLRGLYEAYNQVYSTDYITEEAEIAANYFYEMGLNENGIEILIEELGTEEFTNFVYDIAESYYLNERKLRPGERSLPARTVSRITGDTPSRPVGAARSAVQRARARRTAPPELTSRQQRIRAYSQSPSVQAGKQASAASLARIRSQTPSQRTTAVQTAQTQQAPSAARKPRDVKDQIAGFIIGRLDAHDRAIRSPRAQAVGRALTQIGDIGGRVFDAAAKRAERDTKRVAAATRSAVRRNINASYDPYELVLDHLLDEGYAESLDTAYNIMQYMSEEWIDSIIYEKVKVQVPPTSLSKLGPNQSLFSDAELQGHRTAKEIEDTKNRRNKRGTTRLTFEVR